MGRARIQRLLKDLKENHEREIVNAAGIFATAQAAVNGMGEAIAHAEKAQQLTLDTGAVLKAVENAPGLEDYVSLEIDRTYLSKQLTQFHLALSEHEQNDVVGRMASYLGERSPLGVRRSGQVLNGARALSVEAEAVLATAKELGAISFYEKAEQILEWQKGRAANDKITVSGERNSFEIGDTQGNGLFLVTEGVVQWADLEPHHLEAIAQLHQECQQAFLHQTIERQSQEIEVLHEALEMAQEKIEVMEAEIDERIHPELYASEAIDHLQLLRDESHAKAQATLEKYPRLGDVEIETEADELIGQPRLEAIAVSHQGLQLDQSFHRQINQILEWSNGHDSNSKLEIYGSPSSFGIENRKGQIIYFEEEREVTLNHLQAHHLEAITELHQECQAEMLDRIILENLEAEDINAPAPKDLVGQPLNETEFEVIQSVFDAALCDSPDVVAIAVQQAQMDSEGLEQLMGKFGLEPEEYRVELEEEVEV